MDASEYNAEQKSAITSVKPVVIVPAGPGSGKSHTLVGRVWWLVTEQKVASNRIVILTFTNNAARVLAGRLAAKGISVGYCGTLHGFCMRILQNYGGLLGYRSSTITILTEQAKEQLLEQVKVELGHRKMPLKELHLRQSTPAQLIWAEYEFRLKRSNMVDYDKILTDALVLIGRNSVKLLLAFEISDLLVDERQDSGAVDSDIFAALPVTRRFYVGDVDQCIYAFRGAAPELFVKEANEFGYIALEKNHRSDKEICRVANNLITHNKNRIGKLIVPVSKEQGELSRCYSFDNCGAEIYGVWDQIKKIMATTPAKEIAVLARTNAIADKFRETLRGLGLPVAGNRFEKMPEDWQLAVTVVSLLVDPANDFHAEAILRAKKVDESKILELKTQAAKSEPRQWLSTVALLPNTRPASMTDALIILQSLVSQESVTIIRQRIEFLPEDSTLTDLLVDLWRRVWEADKTEEGVTVTTVHQAKGSEWDCVFVVGMEEGVFPSKPGLESGIEEERRLCFVAITRARHRLCLTWARKRTAYFKTTDQTMSRFIDEMATNPPKYE